MSRMVDIEKVLKKYENYQSFTGYPEYDDGVDSGVLHVIDELEYLPVLNGKYMDNKELEIIKKMVIHGIYKVCLMNDYNPTVFKKFKEEQERLFDNYVVNNNLKETF